MKRVLVLGGVLCLAALAYAGSPFYIPPPIPSAQAVFRGTGTNDCVTYDETGALGCTRNADEAPTAFAVRPQGAYAGAAVNVTGANLDLAAGASTMTIVIDDSTKCAGDTVTVTLNGSANVLTEGVSWARGASNAAACTSLASAVNALSGVDAACATATVQITADHTETVNKRTTLAESDGTCTTVSTNSAGTVVSWHNSKMGVLGLTLGIDADGDTGWYAGTDDIPAFKVNGTEELLWSGNSLKTTHRVVLSGTITDNDGACAIANAANITNFTFPVLGAGTTRYFWTIRGAASTTTATTTGFGIGWNGPAATAIVQSCFMGGVTSALGSNINAQGSVSCSASGNATAHGFMCWGEIDPSADGTMQAVLATEVAGETATLLSAVLEWWY